MNKETEIKLRVSRQTLTALREHPLLKKRNKSGWQTGDLGNQYYDTAQHDLAAAQVALRLRRDAEQVIQTLKSRGQSVAGLSERSEWDWYLETPELDLSKLDDSCWPAALADLDKSTLAPIFSTNFQREKAEIAWGRGKSKVVIEAALDCGEVKAADQQEALCELELELRQGEPQALLELACELAADLPLMPCDISKAERGYRLLDPASYRLQLPPPALSAECCLDDGFAAIAWHLLGNSQRLAEQYRFNGHWRLLKDWLQQLIDLRALLASLGQAAPRASSHELRERLDQFIHDWRPRVSAGRQDDAVRQASHALFLAELEQPRWGLFSLKTSLWLLTRHWQTARTPRGQRQGAATLDQWLQHQLSEDAKALQLLRYVQQPELLLDQAPRLERILLWLRYARQDVSVVELDRLYGELNKLYDMAQNRNPEQAAEQSQQAQIVFSLKAWKVLLK